MQVMTHSTTSIIVFGASGRMGSRICAIALEDPSYALAGAVERAGSARLGQRVGADSGGREIVLKTPEKQCDTRDRADVVIDFSSDEGSVLSARIAEQSQSAMLVGTTALSDASIAALKKLSTTRAVLVAPNTSLGVAVLADLAHRAARLLGPSYECSIVEAHHSKKLDAPSGTALRLARAVRDAGHPLKDDQILAMRGGDVVGEHTIRFAAPGEYIELTHRATTRDLFARGALHAAAWLKGKPPGWYTINDVLGITA
jgi:4-hydroxy-tetrahydrodipicolinate reductase